MILLYRPGSSILHRLGAGPKLVALSVVAVVLSIYPHDGWSIGLTLAGIAVLYLVAAMPVAVLWREIWRLRWLVVVLGAGLAVFVSPLLAVVSTGRVVALLLLAALLTLTTRMADILAVLHRLLRPLRRRGVDVDAVAMAISLTIAMTPVVASFADRLREAQRARGVRLGVRAVVPLLVLALRHADEVGDALAARGLT
ncbi:CbiQ family ECF transporter T component [Microbacterium sp.]|uniref:CbiQ family ECF transporter T component n=1 Tax=Microbacterium sp. TaxID=51671 RepID=UPI002811E25B|nr:CbiQ family ECF transporter T component [Microbacterium sp.]